MTHAERLRDFAENVERAVRPLATLYDAADDMDTIGQLVQQLRDMLDEDLENDRIATAASVAAVDILKRIDRLLGNGECE